MLGGEGKFVCTKHHEAIPAAVCELGPRLGTALGAEFILLKHVKGGILKTDESSTLRVDGRTMNRELYGLTDTFSLQTRASRIANIIFLYLTTPTLCDFSIPI